MIRDNLRKVFFFPISELWQVKLGQMIRRYLEICLYAYRQKRDKEYNQVEVVNLQKKAQKNLLINSKRWMSGQAPRLAIVNHSFQHVFNAIRCDIRVRYTKQIGCRYTVATKENLHYVYNMTNGNTKINSQTLYGTVTHYVPYARLLRLHLYVITDVRL